MISKEQALYEIIIKLTEDLSDDRFNELLATLIGIRHWIAEPGTLLLEAKVVDLAAIGREEELTVSKAFVSFIPAGTE